MNLNLLVKRYLENVLGTAVAEVDLCAQATLLPYYLQDLFEYKQVELVGQPIILAMQKTLPQQPLREVSVQLARISESLKLPVVYCLTHLASYQRRNLIERKVAFIVPGNQMYLPDLGIDLREHFRPSSKTKLKQFSPSTQAILIWHLLNQPIQDHWFLSESALTLGYTLMTATRAIKELVEANLVEVILVGRKKNLRMLHSRETTWQKAKPFMRSPVKRTFWAQGPLTLIPPNIKLSGLSALSEQTMLSGPPQTCFAMTAEQWQEAVKQGVQEIPDLETRTDTYELEIWAYSPAITVESKTVDLLSLWLSLNTCTDDRVQMALDQLQEQINGKWARTI